MIKSLYEITECPDCASQNIIYNEKSMQIICKECGLIYDPLKPVKEVSFGALSKETNNEKIIRPVEKRPVQRKPAAAPAKPTPRPKARKAKKPARKSPKTKPRRAKKARPMPPKTRKKAAKRVHKPRLSKRRTIGARVRGLVKRLIKR